MDTDPVERARPRRTSNADQERLITLDEAFTESSDHGRANAKCPRRLSPETLQREANQRLRERKLRKEQQRQHSDSPLLNPPQTTSKTIHHPRTEKAFWSSVDFSSF